MEIKETFHRLSTAGAVVIGCLFGAGLLAQGRLPQDRLPQDRLPQATGAAPAGLFDTLYARGSFTGCVLVAEDGAVLLRKAYGEADMESGEKLSVRSCFELASVSKVFTGLAVMQLKERGLLSYDDSLRRFFPELPYTGVQIRHLLNHTSGVPDFLRWNDKELNTSRIYTNSEILQKLSGLSRENTAPGEGASYSNTNYLLLAAIVEKVSGMPFARYMQENIFLPAGMTRTLARSRFSKEGLDDAAKDYVWDGSRNRFVRADSLRPYTYYMAEVTGAYGVWSNLDDLLKWSEALSGNKLVKEATLREALRLGDITFQEETAAKAPGLPGVFGWGFSGGNELFSLGSYGGFTSSIVWNPTKKRMVILLSNKIEVTDVAAITGAVVQLLKGEVPELPPVVHFPKGTVLPPASLGAFEGVYARDETSVEITRRGRTLYIRGKQGMERCLFPESENVFFFVGAPGKITFSRDGAGNVTRLALTGNGPASVMTKQSPGK